MWYIAVQAQGYARQGRELRISDTRQPGGTAVWFEAGVVVPL